MRCLNSVSAFTAAVTPLVSETMKGLAVARSKRRVKFLVGDAAVLDIQRVQRHRVERAAHGVEMLLIAPRGRERRRGGLDDGPQLEQAMEHFGLGFARKCPRKHVRIEQMPFSSALTRVPTRGRLLHQPLGGEDAQRLAIRGARDLALLAGFDFAIEHVAGR